MSGNIPNWRAWSEFFAARAHRPVPTLGPAGIYTGVPDSVAKSLAIFQLGESGGGTIVEQVRRGTWPGTNRHYGDAIALFVKEENRHADILGDCVKALGGTLIANNWTAKLFISGRRLIGLRLKVLVLLAAEVVGICYYHLLATRLPSSPMKSALIQLVNDEQSHLHFHCDFLRSQTPGILRRGLFLGAWRLIMTLAALVVLIDHRHALRDLGLAPITVLRRWRSYSRLAERLVINTDRYYQVESWT